MSALQNEEEEPLNVDSEPEEEEKISPYQNESYHLMQDTLSNESESNECSTIHSSDFSSSSFLLCRIAIFLYAFVSILIFRCIPSSQILNKADTISTAWIGWFKFYLFVNIIGCTLGIIGVYVNRARLVLICWLFLSVSLFLTSFLLISYVFNKDEGVRYEATNRCNQWRENVDSFRNKYSLDECVQLMQDQLIWIVIGLFVIYSIAALFGIWVIRSHERYIRHFLVRHPRKLSMKRQSESSLSDIQLEEESANMNHIESKKEK